MIKTIVLGTGTLVGVGILAYVTRRWWMPLVSEIRNGGKLSTKVKKELIDKLSYEYIIKCAHGVLSNSESNALKTGDAKLMVMPNKVAQDYYRFTQRQGQPFFIGEKLTDIETAKMVVVLVSTSDSTEDIIWGRVFVPNELTEDFSDFIPDDKMYIRPISLDANNDKSSARIIPLDGTLQPYAQENGIIARTSWEETIVKACESSVWQIDGVFTISDSLVNYIYETMEKEPEYEPLAAYISGPKSLLNFIQAEETNENSNAIILPDFKRRLIDASQNGEVLLLCKVKESDGQVHILNPTFVKAGQGFETKIKDALDQDKLYEQKVSIQ